MSRADEELIARLARGQHGLVTRAQLVNAGFSSRKLDRRVAAGRLRIVQRGVYQVGPLQSARAREMAAVLACGAGAYVSYRTAASLWELLPAEASADVHVTVVGRDTGRRPGIIAHRVDYLEKSEYASIDGIPVTAPVRTLFDLAGVVRGRELEQALAQVLDRRFSTRSELLSMASHHAGRRWIRALRSLLVAAGEPALAQSEAEERFLALIRKARLSAPEANKRLGDHRVDFLWRRERLVAEVDGFAFHSSARRFEADRCRDADLSALGFRVIRVTWRRIVHEPEMLLVRLAQALARSG